MEGMLRTPLLALGLLSAALLASAKSADKGGIQGDWRTPGGASVRIAPCGGEVCATLLQLEPTAPTHLDANNPDPTKRQQKLCGLQIGYGFHLTDPNHADDGHLYDPKNGKTYRGTMSSEGDRLSLRGYIGIKAFGRTEEWKRLPQSVQACS
jgi:uncharacterized protein (DUF2147 family)